MGANDQDVKAVVEPKESTVLWVLTARIDQLEDEVKRQRDCVRVLAEKTSHRRY